MVAENTQTTRIMAQQVQTHRRITASGLISSKNINNIDPRSWNFICYSAATQIRPCWAGSINFHLFTPPVWHTGFLGSWRFRNITRIFVVLEDVIPFETWVSTKRLVASLTVIQCLCALCANCALTSLFHLSGVVSQSWLEAIRD